MRDVPVAPRAARSLLSGTIRGRRLLRALLLMLLGGLGLLGAHPAGAAADSAVAATPTERVASFDSVVAPTIAAAVVPSDTTVSSRPTLPLAAA